MQQIPRLRLVCMWRTTGAGSLIRTVRHDSHMARNARFSVCLMVTALVCLSATTSCQRGSSKISRCRLNLMELQLIKFNWANDNGKSTNDSPSWDDLRPYFPNRWSNSIPTCPAGGAYTIGPAREKPKCSVGGGFDHSLL